MTIYMPPGYVSYQDFFDKILNSLLKDKPEKEKIRDAVGVCGFLTAMYYNRFAFYDLDDQNRKALEEVLTDFEASQNKSIFFNYIQIQYLKSDDNLDVYSIYKGSGSTLTFNSYNNNRYDVTEYLEKHDYTSNSLNEDRCAREKDNEEVGHHKIIELYCGCYHPLEERSYTRDHFLSILYTSQALRLMRDALCTSVKSFLPSNLDSPIEKEKWRNTNWWHTLLINTFKRYEKRGLYLFNEEDVLKYCNEAKPSTRQYDSIGLKVAIEATDELGERLEEKAKIDEVKGTIKKIIQQNYPAYSWFFTPTKIDSLATLIRPPEKARGGLKKLKSTKM